MTKGWRYTIKSDIMKVLSEEYCTAGNIFDMLGPKYKNHTNVHSLGMYLSQMARDGMLVREVVNYADGKYIRHYVYRKKTEEDLAFEAMRAAEDRALDEWQEGHDFQWSEE